MTLELDLVHYGALGMAECAGGGEGNASVILGLIDRRLEALGPGDTLVMRIHRPVPDGHPLAGVALPPVQAVDEPLEPDLPRAPLTPRDDHPER